MTVAVDIAIVGGKAAAEFIHRPYRTVRHASG
jgi:hypothetical protein